MFSMSNVSGIASIISLIIAGITLHKVNKMENRFLLNVRVKEYIKELEAISREITKILGDFDNNVELVHEKLALTDVKLRNIQKSAINELAKDLKTARHRIEVFRSNKSVDGNYAFESKAREIVTDINIIIEELKNQDKNREIIR